MNKGILVDVVAGLRFPYQIDNRGMGKTLGQDSRDQYV